MIPAALDVFANPVGLTPPEDSGDGLLLPCFLGIIDQLPVQVRAKLKTLDPTKTLVTLKSAVNGKTRPNEPLGFFITDFGAECAEMLGKGGKIFVSVDPNDGKTPRWGFAFVAPDPANVENLSKTDVEIQELKRQLGEMGQLLKLNASLAATAPQQSLADRLQEMKLMAETMRAFQGPPQQAVDVGAQMASMATAFSAMAGGVQQINQAAGKMAPAATPTAVGEIKEALDHPVIAKVVEKGLDRLFTPKPASGPTEVKDNPFAGSSAGVAVA